MKAVYSWLDEWPSRIALVHSTREASNLFSKAVWTDLAKYRVEGFPNHFFSDLWAVGFWRIDHAHGHDGRGLDDCIAGVRGLAVAARLQGPERPKVSRSPALFCGS